MCVWGFLGCLASLKNRLLWPAARLVPEFEKLFTPVNISGAPSNRESAAIVWGLIQSQTEVLDRHERDQFAATVALCAQDRLGVEFIAGGSIEKLCKSVGAHVSCPGEKGQPWGAGLS